MNIDNDLCFCDGPWFDLEPGDRPESVLQRAHRFGFDGCRRANKPEWMRRKDRGQLHAKELTYR